MLKWIAEVVFLLVISFIAYIICVSVNRKPMAQMVLLVAVMLFLLTTIENLLPIMRKAQAKAQSIEQKVDNMQKSIDKFSNGVEGAGKAFKFGTPNLPGQEWAK